MGEKTTIAWTDHTFNPVIGCTKIGPGCDNCYAESQDSRKRWDGGRTHWGAGVPRYRTSESNWKQPLMWNRKAAAKEKRARVFCASLSDVFDNEWPEGAREDLWRLIDKTPWLEWLLLTKRIGNVAGMVPQNWLNRCNRWHWPVNVRLMITVVNQDEADRDIPKLLALPCKNGISYEPALGPVEWDGYVCSPGALDGWLIIGGESGPKARPFDLDWASRAIYQCKTAGVPVFFKQYGSHPMFCRGRVYLKDRAGADPAEWLDCFRVQEFPK
mgnify:CR=1 FL=1